MKKVFDTDVFVVGGGPAGLAAAIASAQRGLRVIVADRAQPPIDKACGEGLMPDSLDVLARLGVSLEGCETGTFHGIKFLGPGSSVAADSLKVAAWASGVFCCTSYCWSKRKSMM